MATAAIGFRAKTGRAIVVVLAAGANQPSFVLRREVSLVDPHIPETGQPYHEVMDLPWPEATAAAQRFVVAIEAVASAVVGTLVRELKADGLVVKRIGIVGSPDQKLERIGNPHIRAHGAEGILFRRVLEVAAAAHGMPSQSFSEKTLAKADAPAAAWMNAVGKEAGSPWRADEKRAATAAWLVLGGAARPARPADR